MAFVAVLFFLVSVGFASKWGYHLYGWSVERGPVRKQHDAAAVGAFVAALLSFVLATATVVVGMAGRN